jgi:hypothetical protein
MRKILRSNSTDQPDDRARPSTVFSIFKVKSDTLNAMSGPFVNYCKNGKSKGRDDADFSANAELSAESGEVSAAESCSALASRRE